MYLLSDVERLEGNSAAGIDRELPDRSARLSIRCLRNACASFQIVVADAEDAPLDIACRMDDAALAPTFALYEEWFHQWQGMRIPDLLIPLDRMAEPERLALRKQYGATRIRVFWVDCHIPKDAQPGTYTGSIAVTRAGIAAEAAFELQVDAGILCSRALLHADFNNYADVISKNNPALFANKERYFDGTYLAEEREYFRMTHDHRAFFHYLPYGHSGFNYLTFAPKLEGEGKAIRVSDWTAYDEHFGPYFDGTAFEGGARRASPIPFFYLPFCLDWPSSYEKWGTPGFAIENRRVFLDFLRHFEEKGWTETVFELFLNHKKRYRFFPYDGDEIRHAHDEALARIQQSIFGDLLRQSTVQALLRTDSSWSYGKHYDSWMSDVFGMWTVGTGLAEFYAESFGVMREKGNYLFEYTGLPTMEKPLTRLYELPTRCLMNGATGILYWNATGVGDDYLTCPVNGGAEVFLYPAHLLGIDGGPLPSLRMKYHRNAMQTMDFIKMHEGTDCYLQMKAAVNEAFGTTGDQWTSPLPEALQVEPQDMANEDIEHAMRNDPGKNATADLPARLLARVLDLSAASGLRLPDVD